MTWRRHRSTLSSSSVADASAYFFTSTAIMSKAFEDWSRPMWKILASAMPLRAPDAVIATDELLEERHDLEGGVVNLPVEANRNTDFL
jgi:hypothetical protein